MNRRRFLTLGLTAIAAAVAGPSIAKALPVSDKLAVVGAQLTPEMGAAISYRFVYVVKVLDNQSYKYRVISPVQLLA